MRLKCDETKPHCIRCQKQQVECDYTAQPVRSKPPQHAVAQFIASCPDLISRESLSSSMSLLLVSEKLSEVLQLELTSAGPPGCKTRPGSLRTGRLLEALQHFNLTSVASYSAQKNFSKMENMRIKMTQLAFEVSIPNPSIHSSYLCP